MKLRIKKGLLIDVFNYVGANEKRVFIQYSEI